jgi:hypothetical protein
MYLGAEEAAWGDRGTHLLYGGHLTILRFHFYLEQYLINFANKTNEMKLKGLW